MENRIVQFIKDHKVMTMATCADDQPYCSVLFYSFDEKQEVLYYLSKLSSRHAKELQANHRVSGSIIRGENNIVKLQGIQFIGTCDLVDQKFIGEAKRHFLSEHPYAVFGTDVIWCLRLEWIKMTDNTIGFGKKIIWERKKSTMAS